MNPFAEPSTTPNSTSNRGSNPPRQGISSSITSGNPPQTSSTWSLFSSLGASQPPLAASSSSQSRNNPPLQQQQSPPTSSPSSTTMLTSQTNKPKPSPKQSSPNNPFALDEASVPLSNEGNPFALDSTTTTQPSRSQIIKQNPFLQSPSLPAPTQALTHFEDAPPEVTISSAYGMEKGGFLQRLALGDGMALEGQHQGRVSRRDLTSMSSSYALTRDNSVSVRDQVSGVFLDPSGTHGLVTVSTEATFYVAMQAATLKARGPVASGLSVFCVVWFRQPTAYTNPDPSNDEWFALLGTASGTVHECIVTSHAGVADVATVFNSPDLGQIVGLAVRFNPLTAKYRVAMTTSRGRFRVSGEALSPSDAFRHHSELASSGELDGPACKSYSAGEAVLFDSASTTSLEAEAWFLSSVGLTKIVVSQDGHLVSRSLTRLPEHTEPTGAMAQTELHILVLCSALRRGSSTSTGGGLAGGGALGANHWVVCISKITCAIVYETRRHDVYESPPIGIAKDEVRNAVWLFSTRGVARVEIRGERRGAVRLMLARALQTRSEGDFHRALDLCTSPTERDQVLLAHAEDAFARGRLVAAAKLWAKVSLGTGSASGATFEQIALRLANESRTLPSQDQPNFQEDDERRGALRIFLRLRLEALPPTAKKTTKTILAVWLVQVFLDDMLETNPSAEKILVEFWEFLNTNRDNLAPAKETVFHLLSSHGRVDLVLFYAELMQDYDRIVTHHVHRGAPEEAVRELSRVLSQWREMEGVDRAPPKALQELIYRHAPTLLPASPEAMTRVLIDAPFLEPVKLIPAFARLGSQVQPAISYLEHCVGVWGVRDEAVHNYLLSLYVDEAVRHNSQNGNHAKERLTKYVRSQTSQPGGCCFDAGFALRLCTSRGDAVDSATRVLLHDAMDVPEEAVKVALESGLSNAAEKIASERTLRDPEVGKRLWLLILREVAVSGGVSRALETLKKAGGVVTVEDLLMVLPELTSVDEIRDHVCSALEKSADDIDRLKAEINEFSQSAEGLKRDAQDERLHFDTVSRNKRCDLCRTRATTRDFFLFPCTHCIHADCLAQEIASHLAPDVRTALERKRASKKESDQAEVDEFLGSSCPLCGELMVQSVVEPLILARDDAEARLWD